VPTVPARFDIVIYQSRQIDANANAVRIPSGCTRYVDSLSNQFLVVYLVVHRYPVVQDHEPYPGGIFPYLVNETLVPISQFAAVADLGSGTTLRDWQSRNEGGADLTGDARASFSSEWQDGKEQREEGKKTGTARVGKL
jgi:hypothetical protein